VLDRTAQSQDEMVGRFDLDARSAQPFVQPEGEEPGALWPEPVPESPVGLPALSPEQIAEAAKALLGAQVAQAAGGGRASE